MDQQRRGRLSFSHQSFDVLIIGGGIAGAAIARECAQRGMRTLIVEQNDFASGTTSRSTRIVHGGLRRLEHGDLAYARECLRESQQMMARWPHLVKPMRFLLAFPRNPLAMHSSSGLAFRAALWLRQLWNEAKNREKDETQEFEAELDAGQNFSVYSCEDAQCEFPERIVVEWLLEAEATGAVAANYTQVLKVTRSSGRASGARLRDTLSGEEFNVGATWVINATGAWAGRVVHESNISAEPLADGVRGSHLVLPEFPGAPKHAVRVETSEGRATTVIPWNGQLLVGTTHAPDERDPGEAAPERLEIDYLMNSFTRLFPASGLSRADIRASFSGIWAAPRGEGEKTTQFGGKYVLHEHGEQGAAGLISVTGGNLATAAGVARDVARRMGLAMAKPATTAFLSSSDDILEKALQHQVRLVALKGGIGQSCARDLAEWYGRNALAVAQIASLDARLRQPICSHSAHLLAEAVYAAQQEHAVTLADIVLRRVPVALGPCWSEACSHDAAARIGSVLGWEKERIAMEFEDLEAERERFLHPRTNALPVSIPGTSAAEAA